MQFDQVADDRQSQASLTTVSTRPPGVVNLTTFDSRLATICCSRDGSRFLVPTNCWMTRLATVVTSTDAQAMVCDRIAYRPLTMSPADAPTHCSPLL